MSDSLTWAVKHGDLVALRNALQSAPDLNGVDSQGWSPLFHAAHRGNAEAIRLLIGAGADVNLGHETGFTALSRRSRMDTSKRFAPCSTRERKRLLCRESLYVPIAIAKIPNGTKPFWPCWTGAIPIPLYRTPELVAWHLSDNATYQELANEAQLNQGAVFQRP